MECLKNKEAKKELNNKNKTAVLTKQKDNDYSLTKRAKTNETWKEGGKSLISRDYQSPYSAEKTNKNDKDLSNKSTLSLHIAAYENTLNANCDINDEKVKSVTKEANKTDIKKQKCPKQCFSTSSLKSFYEIPRQQENVSKTKPEIMQFKASQKLQNPQQQASSKFARSEKTHQEKGERRSVQAGAAASEDNIDEIFDEVNKVPQELDKEIIGDLNKGKKKQHCETEVLGVVASSESENDEYYDSDDSEDSVDERLGKKKANSDELGMKSADAWTKKELAYYGSHADKDYGGCNSVEGEALELEEEDAINRQKKLDAIIQGIDFGGVIGFPRIMSLTEFRLMNRPITIFSLREVDTKASVAMPISSSRQAVSQSLLRQPTPISSLRQTSSSMQHPFPIIPIRQGILVEQPPGLQKARRILPKAPINRRSLPPIPVRRQLPSIPVRRQLPSIPVRRQLPLAPSFLASSDSCKTISSSSSSSCQSRSCPTSPQKQLMLTAGSKPTNFKALIQSLKTAVNPKPPVVIWTDPQEHCWGYGLSNKPFKIRIYTNIKSAILVQVDMPPEVILVKKNGQILSKLQDPTIKISGESYEELTVKQYCPVNFSGVHKRLVINFSAYQMKAEDAVLKTILKNKDRNSVCEEKFEIIFL